MIRHNKKRRRWEVLTASQGELFISGFYSTQAQAEQHDRENLMVETAIQHGESLNIDPASAITWEGPPCAILQLEGPHS